MRWFLLMFLVSCSSAKLPSDYLTPVEIVNQFETLGDQGPSIQELAPLPDIVRNLTPNDEFLGSKKAERQKFLQEQFLAGKPTRVDLRAKDAPIVSQWNGTCTAHGLSGTIENLAGVNLSERHVWSRYQKYSCESAINAWQNNVACMTSETGWPHENKSPKTGYQNPQNCFTTLGKTTYIGSSLNKMVSSLNLGRPVYLGIQVTSSMANCSKVLSPTSSPTSGGHALSIVGYETNEKVPGGGYFIIRNSWGTDCGDRGYQYIPFNYCTRNDLYCIMWTIDSIKVKGSIK